MIVVCRGCGNVQVKHDRSIRSVKGFCERCRQARLRRLKFLSTRHPALLPILVYRKIAHVAKR